MRARPVLLLGPLAILALLLAAHLPFLRMPYFWDELGQFVPASLDLFRDEFWIPRTTLPNAHPPGLMAILAAVWSLFGYSIAMTRVAMLAISALTVFVAFLLAQKLCAGDRQAPVIAVALLLASPLFYAQSMLAQLDLPATLFTLVALLLFLEERFLAAALAATALVLVKETGIVAPAVFALWLLRERKWKQAALFLIPAVALAAWFVILERSTGHLFGNREFTDFNLTYPLHPVRLPVAILRRLYFVFIADFHWIGTLAILGAWRRARVYAGRPWQIVTLLAAAQLFLVSALGGATLDRYLLPVIPLFYIAVAAATHARWRLVLVPGLVIALFWNPPYPFSFENNLALTDFVALQQDAARYLEEHSPRATVVTAWPLTDALRRPEFGYISQPIRVREIHNLNRSTVRGLSLAPDEVVVLYARSWEPRWSWLHVPAFRAFLDRFYQYEDAATPDDCREALRLERKARWTRRGQWIEIYGRPG